MKLTRTLFFLRAEPSTDEGVSEVSLIALPPVAMGEFARMDDDGECFMADLTGETPRWGGSWWTTSIIGEAEKRADRDGLWELPLTRPLLSEPERGTSRLSDRWRLPPGVPPEGAERIVVFENPLKPLVCLL